MRRRLFEPLGMEHTSFRHDSRVTDRLAVGYRLRGGRMKPVKDLDITAGPAGACFSSTEDMGRYAAALANGGGPVLRAETLEQMLVPDPLAPAMGLSFFLDRMNGHRVAGHDGGWSGFISAMLVAPDDGIGVVAFANTTSGTTQSSWRASKRSSSSRSAEERGMPRRKGLMGEGARAVVFERVDDDRVGSLYAGSPREGFLRVHRRPRATSVRLWTRGLLGASVLGAVVQAVRRRLRS